MSRFVIVVENPDADPDVTIVGDDVELYEFTSYPTTNHCPKDEVSDYVDGWLTTLARTDLPEQVRKIVQHLLTATQERFGDDVWGEILSDIEGDHTVAALPAGDKDRLYNRVLEHNDGEHTTSWDGCPWCDGDSELAEAIERYYGIGGTK